MFRKKNTIKFTLYSGGLFSAALNQDVQKQLRTLDIFPEFPQKKEADFLKGTTVTPVNSDMEMEEAIPIEEVKAILLAIQEPNWQKVISRAQFLHEFLKFKSQYQEMGDFLNAFKTSLKNIDLNKIIHWLTNGDENLEQLFADKNQYPKTPNSMLAVFVAIFEIYCKERLKMPEIKSYGGWLASFAIKVYNSSEKVEAMSAAQLDILKNGVQGFERRLNDSTSTLFSYRAILLENKSDTKKIIEQLLQFPQTKEYETKYWPTVPRRLNN